MRQHAEPLSFDTHFSEIIPSAYSTSGMDTASVIPFDVQTAFLSGNTSSEVSLPTPVAPTVRFTADYPRPPTPKCADYPLRVDGITIYQPQADPRSTFLTEHFLNNKYNIR